MIASIIKVCLNNTAPNHLLQRSRQDLVRGETRSKRPVQGTETQRTEGVNGEGEVGLQDVNTSKIQPIPMKATRALAFGLQYLHVFWKFFICC